MTSPSSRDSLESAVNVGLLALGWGFLVIAGGLLILAGVGLFRGTEGVTNRTVAAVSDVLLAVIMVELAQTVLQQLRRHDESKGKTGTGSLSVDLLSDLLVVGVVAAVRHLLAVSAQLNLTSAAVANLQPRESLMFEFGLTALIVVLLAAGWVWTLGRAKKH